MALVYATPAQLEAGWTDDTEPPADPARYLAAASRRVRNATRRAVYETTSGSLPADPDLADAMREAVLEQVRFWSVNSIDPATVAVTQPKQQVASKSMGGRSISYTTDDPTVAQIRRQAAAELCDDAALILTEAGLLSGQPWAY